MKGEVVNLLLKQTNTLYKKEKNDSRNNPLTLDGQLTYTYTMEESKKHEN